MDSIVRFNAQTTGRDKLFRLCQYTARIIWSLLDKYKRNKEWVNKLKDLENNLSISRKLLRLGRCLDIMHSALQSSHLPNSTLRITLTLSRITSSLYLLCDHILWFSKIGLINVDRNKWSVWSNKFWLYSITMNLIRDFYEMMSLFKISYQSNANPNPTHHLYSFKTCSSSQISLENSINWIMRHKNVSVDTLKNACDLMIPMTSLGNTKLSPTMIGILGSISSLLSIIQIFDYTFRLSPS